MSKNFLLAILFSLPMAANAHSPLVSSYPQNGEILDLPPAEIVMEFKSPSKLIKVDLKKSHVNQGTSMLGTWFGGGDSDSDTVSLGKSF